MVQHQGRISGLVFQSVLLVSLMLMGSCSVDEDLQVSQKTQACTPSPAPEGVFAQAYRSIWLKKKTAI